MRELDGSLWYIANNGYRYARRNYELIAQHRYVWEKANGQIPEGWEIDHIDGDRLNNNLDNLRAVPPNENKRNLKKLEINTSGVTGVSWDKGTSKWRAYLHLDSKRKYLGVHTDWFEAVCARMSANNLYGFHENHGRR